MEDTKWCFVPTCLNSTKNTVNKWFVPIPTRAKRRELWFKAVNRNYCPDSERSTLYCCSDHFNLDEDAGSFYERNGEVVVTLKKSIFPRLNQGPLVSPKPITSMQLTPRNRLVRMGAVKETITPPQPTISEVVNLIDGSSSEEDGPVDVIGVTSESCESKKLPGIAKVANTKQSSCTSSSVKSSSIQQSTVKVRKPRSKNSPNAASSASNIVGKGCRQTVKAHFDSLRKAIPSISSQQGLTREQILDEAIEFIMQMRNKTDNRQGSMNYIMESNASLNAKIQHLEHLIALHEKNEIVLTREIVDRRLVAVGAAKHPSLQSKQSKEKSKR